MKRIIVYILLSLILVAPIATITAIVIINSNDITYSTTEVFSNDLSKLETTCVSTESFEEELSLLGKFDNSGSCIESLTIPNSAEENIAIFCEIGDILKKDDLICISKGTKYQCKEDSLLVGISEQYNTVTFYLQTLEVSNISVSIPTEDYYTLENSTVSFSWGDNKYDDISCSKVLRCADESGKTVTAIYNLEALDCSKFLYGGSVDVVIKTGKTVEGAFSVPQNYIFISDDGKYYIEVISSDIINKVYIKLGIFGNGVVQIITDEDISSNTKIVANSTNVFNSIGSSNE